MKHFPQEGRVRLPPVVAFTALSYSSLKRRWIAGQFPAPVRYGHRCLLFDAAAVREWAADPEGWASAQATDGVAAA